MLITTLSHYFLIRSLVVFIAIIGIVRLEPPFYRSLLLNMDSISALMLWLCIGAILRSFMISSLTSLVRLWWFTSIIVTLAFSASKLLVFYVLFEARLIPILLILMYSGSQPERLSARIYFLAYTLFFSLPFILVIIIILPIQIIVLHTKLELASTLSIIMIGLFIVKMPVFGLHFWLPKAHVEASTSGSMILAGLLLKLGSFGVARLWLFMPLIVTTWTIGFWLLLATIRSIITFFQSDLKKFVAYRRVTHITFLIIGLSRNRKLIFSRAILIGLAHGWASIAIFSISGRITHRRQSRLEFIRYWEYALHWLALIFGVSLLMNASIPPFPSFYPEVLILHIVKSILGWGILVFVALRFFVCYYNALLYILIMHKKPVVVISGTVSLVEAFNQNCLFLLGVVTVLTFRMLFKLYNRLLLCSLCLTKL